MLAYLRRMKRSAQDRGASAVEYGLMVAAIAAVIVGVVFGLGAQVRSKFQETTTCISQGTNAPLNGATPCPTP